MEPEKTGPSLGMRAIAFVVLIVAAYVLLRVVIGVVAGFAWIVVLVLAVVGIVWAWRTISS